jgi:iron(III) transport system permease protein
MFSCVLYPYVYLLARTAFLERAGGMLEAARALGLSPWQGFWRVSLPLARPAIAAGMALALMETLADYGTVAYFAVQTFTTGIYRAWFSLGDRVAAAQALRRAARLRRPADPAARARQPRPRALPQHQRPQRAARCARYSPVGMRCWRSWLRDAFAASVSCCRPALLLLALDGRAGDAQFGARFLILARNSFVLAALTARAGGGAAVLLPMPRAARAGWPPRSRPRIVGLGYAVPGSVIAVGVLIPVTRLDHWLAGCGSNWTA